MLECSMAENASVITHMVITASNQTLTATSLVLVIVMRCVVVHGGVLFTARELQQVRNIAE